MRIEGDLVQTRIMLREATQSHAPSPNGTHLLSARQW
jgi:hypothetical protein